MPLYPADFFSEHQGKFRKKHFVSQIIFIKNHIASDLFTSRILTKALSPIYKKKKKKPCMYVVLCFLIFHVSFSFFSEKRY